MPLSPKSGMDDLFVYYIKEELRQPLIKWGHHYKGQGKTLGAFLCFGTCFKIKWMYKIESKLDIPVLTRIVWNVHC